MYKGVPIARKIYSFPATVVSPKIMYKLGSINSNETQTPKYGFDIIFWQTVINFNMGWWLFDSVMMIIFFYQMYFTIHFLRFNLS